MTDHMSKTQQEAFDRRNRNEEWLRGWKHGAIYQPRIPNSSMAYIHGYQVGRQAHRRVMSLVRSFENASDIEMYQVSQSLAADMMDEL